MSFKKMVGFHKLESLWRIDYKAVTVEPFLTKGVSDELRDEIGDMLGKTLPKADLDAVPLVMGDKAVLTGNAVKGIFRHLLSAQLTHAGVDVCAQEIKLRVPESKDEEKIKIEMRSKIGRKEECKPDDPCFVCMWFGTVSRQGALHFSFLKSVKGLDEILTEEPIPMIALAEDTNALKAVRGRGAFALLAPVRGGVEFRGWIKGENLSEEIIGAIKEIQDMSEKGFVHFGGFKTRGFGAVKIEILKVEKYKTVPFGLEKAYEGNELKAFLEECQKKYHGLFPSGG
ncbi:MAG: RAMP superfamily CRISPR-associated protein [Candidatus Bathyarchaeia archaeon]